MSPFTYPSPYNLEFMWNKPLHLKLPTKWRKKDANPFLLRAYTPPPSKCRYGSPTIDHRSNHINGWQRVRIEHRYLQIGDWTQIGAFFNKLELTSYFPSCSTPASSAQNSLLREATLSYWRSSLLVSSTLCSQVTGFYRVERPRIIEVRFLFVVTGGLTLFCLLCSVQCNQFNSF